MKGLLLDIIVGFHFLWILFILFGLLAVRFRPKIAYLHATGLLFSLLLNIMGWYCPLTYAEKYLTVSLQTGNGYEGSFLGHYLIPIIYPDLPERYVRLGGTAFVVVLLVIYGVLIKKYGLFRRAKGASPSGTGAERSAGSGPGHSSH